VAQVVDAHIDEAGRQLQVLFLRRRDALAIGGLLTEFAFKSVKEARGLAALRAGPEADRGPSPQTLPRRLEVGPPCARFPAEDDPGVIESAVNARQDLEGRGAQVDDPGPGLAVRE
jgi:hypothetical protein